MPRSTRPRLGLLTAAMLLSADFRPSPAQETRADAAASRAEASPPGASVAASAPAELDDYDVVFTTPGPDERASMPVGNGLVGANVWTEPDGALAMYVARLDAHSETQRLLKLGRIRVTFDPPLVQGGTPFEQKLRLRDGRIEIRAGADDDAIALFVFIDSGSPVLHVVGTSAKPRRATVEVATLRTERRELRGVELKSSWVLRDAPADVPTWESPDVVLGDAGGIVVAHRNAWSCVPLHVARQALGDAASLVPDPLTDRTFGLKAGGPGLIRTGPSTLASSEAGTAFDLRISTHSAQTSTFEAWRAELDRIAAAADPNRAYARTSAWWRELWGRSYVFVDEPSAPAVPSNRHPFRIGADAHGGNRFPGAIAAYDFVGRAWSREEIIARAAVPPDAIRPPSPHPPFRDEPVDVPEALAPPRDATAFSVGAWVKPSGRTGRIFDRMTPGGSDGFLLDLLHDRPRLIAGSTTLQADAAAATGVWTHIAAVVDGGRGEATLYVNGRPVRHSGADPNSDPTTKSRATRAYLLTRYVAAASARAPRPIPFQGGMFNIAAGLTPNGGGAFRGPADDRNWGASVWWQNARLVHRPFLTQGDAAFARPLLDFYFDRAPLFRAQAKRLFGVDGLFVYETLSIFGLPGMGDWGWTPVDPPAFQEPYTRNIWQQPLEIADFALDAYEHDGDDAYLAAKVLPWADDALRFFLGRFGRDAAGLLVITPSHAVETYWNDVVNDLPTVAGLHAVVRRLSALPDRHLTPERRALYRSVKAVLPPIPRRKVDGVELFAAAERHEQERKNVETPELYCVFPFRSLDLSGPDLGVARETYRRMVNPVRTCWHQTGLFAARLGLADEAARDLTERSGQTARGYRFPGFLGTPNDWTPDLDGAGNLQSVLQEMLVQYEGRKIRLLPAWPAGWSARFRLHAPFRTTIEGEVRDGRLVRFEVTPPSRLADVVVP